MTVDETELDLLKQPVFKRNPYVQPAAHSISAGCEIILSAYMVVRFRERLLVHIQTPAERLIDFDKAFYYGVAGSLLVGCGKSMVNDIYECIRNTVPDLTALSHLICFGKPTDALVWNSRTLAIDDQYSQNECGWISPIKLNLGDKSLHQRHISIKAMLHDDEALYDNVLQSIAPLLMDFKPYGTIWWIGKNPLIDQLIEALHSILPYQLADLNMQRLTGRRQDYRLNECIANVPKLDSELTANDLAVCRSVADHEDRHAHRYHSQRGRTILGNMHHIFHSASFEDVDKKWLHNPDTLHLINFTDGADVPTAKIEPCDLLSEVIWYTQLIKSNGYRYNWQPVDYDSKFVSAESDIVKQPNPLLALDKW